MLLKTKQTPGRRQKTLVYIGGIAQFAFVVSIMLSRLNIDGLDFLEGLLLGFSIVGNLAYLFFTSRRSRSS